jgi:hypothetical protein
MTNKTPFELRFDLLSLAQGILNDKAFADRQRLEQDWNMKRELLMMAAAQQENVKDSDIVPFPELPSVNVDDVIEMARKLNDFVSNSGDNKNA